MTERHTSGNNGRNGTPGRKATRHIAIQTARTGLPELQPYTYRAGDDERLANVQALVDAAKAEALRKHIDWTHTLTVERYLEHRRKCSTCEAKMLHSVDSPAFQAQRRLELL